MSPQQFNTLLTQLKASITEINSAWLVIDDSQLVKTLAEKYKEDNMFLVGVLPSYGTSGSNADSYRNQTTAMLFILEKIDYSDLDQEQFIEVFEETYQVAKAVREKILNLATEGCSGFLRDIFVDSIRIDPEWKKSDCNGWSISFDIG